MAKQEKYKSKYSKEEIDAYKEKIIRLFPNEVEFMFDIGLKYNIWVIVDDIMDKNIIDKFIATMEDNNCNVFTGTIFGKNKTIFMFLPEFD